MTRLDLLSQINDILRRAKKLPDEADGDEARWIIEELIHVLALARRKLKKDSTHAA